LIGLEPYLLTYPKEFHKPFDFSNVGFTSILNAVLSAGDISPVDDFSSYGSQGAIDAVYPTTDTVSARGNISTNKIDYNSIIDGTNNSICRDLGGLVDNTAFVVRFRYNVATTSRNPSGYVVSPVIGLFDVDENTGSNNNQSSCSISPYMDNLVRGYVLYSSTSSLLPYNGTYSKSFTETCTAGDNWYWELTKLSATSLKAECFSNSGYSTSVESQTLTIISTCGEDMRYLGIKNISPQESQTGNQQGYMEHLGFKNGVTSW